MRIGDRAVLGLSIRDHIGGRWAISWIAYVINAPINLLGTSTNVLDARDAPALAWLSIWILGYVVLGLILLLANATFFRNRRLSPVPVWWVFALGAIAGGVRGLVVGVAADEAGLSGGGQEIIALRLVTGTLFGMLLMPTAALLLSLVGSYSSRRRELVSRIVDLERERMQAEGESERLRQMLLADVERGALEAARDPQVRSTRELSHRLWNEAEADVGARHLATPWRGVLREVLTNYPYPAALVAGIWAVSAIWTLTAAIGLARGFIQTAVSAAVIWAAFTMASRVRPSRPTTRLILLIATLIVVNVLTGPVASVIFDPRPPGAGAGQIVANSMWIPLLAIIAGIVVSGVRSSEEVLERLTRTVQEEQIAAMAADEERARIQREVAEALHGVQSRVLSARAAGEDTAFSLADLLDVPWTTDPHTRLARTLETWGLLLHLHVGELPDDLTETQVRDLARVLDEACANAHRHGGASACWIAVDRDEDAVVVRVDDDGHGVPGESAPGLGSGLFATVSGARWSLQRSSRGGAALVVQLG